MAARRNNSRPGSFIHFRVTRAGWLFLLVSLAVGVAAVRSAQQPMMFVLFGGMIGALTISGFLARRGVAGVSVQREGPGRIWQGQTVHIAYFLSNASKRRPCLALYLEQMVPHSMESTRGFCAYVPAGGSFRAGARFAARRRGRYQIEGVRLSTTFPFGLVEVSRTFRERLPLIVWPARGKLKRRLLRHGAVESSTSAPSGVSGGQDEFFGIREYREGDSRRWIYWRRSAGRAVPVVREMAKPLPDVLWVVLDTFEHDVTAAAVERRERLIRFAATLIDHAFFRQYRVGLCWASAEGPSVLAAAAGAGQRSAVLDALAQIGPNNRVRLAEALAALKPRQLEQAQVVVLTDRPDRAADVLAALRRGSRHVRCFGSSDLPHLFADEKSSPEEADAAAEL